ncbi:MAG: FtsW/RodA/SpoVE family cell cycle protein [Syntrophorhabdales bacterium]
MPPCLKISQNTAEPLGSTISFGIASIIFIQFTVNILMVINLAPVVGITLPLISYGGSSPPEGTKEVLQRIARGV